jgi:hypothetical protein
MPRIVLRSTLIAAALVASWTLTVGQADAYNGAACRPYEYGNPDLFYNHYVPPNCGGLGAQLYIAPHPVPPLVGHTYYTYQPLMPHEMLYKHRRTYHRYYNGGRGLTRTSVRWTW